MATIGIGIALLISGTISTRVYFLRKTLNQVDTPNHGQGEVKTKGLARCFPYVNQMARSALGLLSLYVSIMFS